MIWQVLFDVVLVAGAACFLAKELYDGEAFNGRGFISRKAAPGHYWFLILAQVIGITISFIFVAAVSQ